jgi:hypothetical protein
LIASSEPSAQVSRSPAGTRSEPGIGLETGCAASLHPLPTLEQVLQTAITAEARNRPPWLRRFEMLDGHELREGCSVLHHIVLVPLEYDANDVVVDKHADTAGGCKLDLELKARLCEGTRVVARVHFKCRVGGRLSHGARFASANGTGLPSDTRYVPGSATLPRCTRAGSS